MMRILHLLPHLDDIGNGIVNHVVDLACEQSGRGHAVHVASRGGAQENLLRLHGVTHHAVRSDGARSRLRTLRLPTELRRLLSIVDVDVVNTHTVTTLLGVRLASPTRHVPLIATCHNEFSRTAPAVRLADRVIAVSRKTADRLSARGVPTEKIHLVVNGTIGGARSRRLREGSSPKALARPAITTVAGMYERKGIGDLISAFELVAGATPAHLYLVGDGPDKSRFEHQARMSPCGERIHFEGFQSDPWSYLHSTDIFVLASRREPFGIALIEAREVGCAIVASDVDGIPEVLDGGRAGWLYPAGDIDALAGRLRRLMNDEEERLALAHRASNNLDWLTIARVADETEAVYEAAFKLKLFPLS